MNELKTLSFNGNKLILRENHVTSAILPQKSAEMGRDIEIAGETVIEGAVYAHNLVINQGPVTIKGALFVGNDLLIQSCVSELITFNKAVASGGGLTAVPGTGRCCFSADVNAVTITLRNVFVAANVFGSDVTLENCVVLGGVFASKSLNLKNCVLGTFNTPRATLSGKIHLLMPSAFSIEPFNCAPGTVIENLTLADLGNLMKGFPEAEKSGKMLINPESDGQKTSLSDEDGNQIQIHTYTVSAKVLAADLLDLGKLQNHFLLHAGIMGPQLLRNYDLGCGKDGSIIELSQRKIADFFFKILSGEISPQVIDGSFLISDVTKAYAED